MRLEKNYNFKINLLIELMKIDLTLAVALSIFISIPSPALSQDVELISPKFTLPTLTPPVLSETEKEDFEDNGSGGTQKGAGSREGGPKKLEGKVLTALVPEMTIGEKQIPLVLGLTSKAETNLYFYLPYESQPSRKVKFVLLNDEEEEIYEETFQFTEIPGIVTVRLPEVLEVGQKYNWLFIFKYNPRNPSADEFVEGWIKRVELNPELVTELKNATLPEQFLLYANNGLWFDALNIISELRRLNLEDEALKADWTEFLQSVDLEDIAPESIVE